MDFRVVDRRYVELKRQYDNGDLSAEAFDERLEQMMVQDDEDRWWAKSPETGQWYYYDGSAWLQDTPPGYQDVTPEPVTDESPIQTSSALHPKGAEKGGDRRRKVLPRILAAGLLAVVALVGMWTYLRGGDDMAIESGNDAAGEGTPSEEDPKPAPGYQLAEDGSGSLTVEVPSGWEVIIGQESETGGPTWSSFAGESVNSSITATADLDIWRSPGDRVPGIYLVASRKLAQSTDDRLIASGPHDLSAYSCERGAGQDFDRGSYSGRWQEWNCHENQTFLNLVAAPEGRDCVVLLQTVTHSKADRETAQHILDTFDVDCSGI